eukprot:Rmarinus@m.21292
MGIGVACFFIIFCLHRVSGTLLGTLAADASIVGGSGYAVQFSKERSDVISIALGSFEGDAFTLAYWMQVIDDHQDVHAVVNYGAYDSQYTPSLNSPDEFSLSHHADHIEYFRGFNSHHCQKSTCALSPFEWVHVTYTWRALDGLATLYLGGDMVDSYHLSTGEPIIPKGIFVLGQEPHGFVSLYNEDHAFTGILDEVVLMTRELSAQEVKDYADRGRPLDDDDLLLYWTFDDPTATEFVSDLSPNGRDGYIGYLDNRLDELSYATDRPPQPPTSPSFVVSTAPLAGHGPTVTPLHAGESSVKVPLVFALNETKVSVDRRNPHKPISASNGDAVPLLRDYWAAYPNASVTVRVESLPQYGTLRDVESQAVLAEGDVVSSGARVLYELDVDLYESSWAPLQEAAGSILAVPDVFTYSVEGVLGTVHVVASQTVQTPPEKEYHLMEDERGVLILGGLDVFGHEVKCVIKTLPKMGRLFQAFFNESSSYAALVIDESMLTEITAPGTCVTDLSGVVLYIPEPEASSNSLFDSFTYSWINDLGVESLHAANVSLFVEPVNDSPDVHSVTFNFSGNADAVLLVQLNSTDIDETFSEGAVYYKVEEFPHVGTLYNIGAQDANYNQAAEDEFVLGNPLDYVVMHTLNMFPSRVMNASSQDSTCNDVCHYPWLCKCPHGDTAHHWTNALGFPDVYPHYGDNDKAGAFAWSDQEYTPGVGSFIELGLAYAVYPTQVTLYETYHPGSVVRLSVSDTYNGPDTEWYSIWEGASDLAVLSSDVAREWSIPHCPFLHPMSYLRLDLDLSLHPGQEQIDAVRVESMADIPPGYVNDSYGRIAYVPRPGVFSNNDAVYTSFTYTATDCVDTSLEPAVVSIIVDPPTDNTVFISTDYPIYSERLTTVVVNLDSIVEDAISIGVSEDEVSSISARLVSYAGIEFVDLVVYQVANDDNDIGEAFEVGEPLDSPTGAVEYVVSNEHASEARFAILAGHTQGHADLALWVALGHYVYAVRVHMTIVCDPGNWNQASDGACVECRLLLDGQAEGAAGWEQACSLDSCVPGTHAAWLSDTAFECVPCEPGFYSPVSGLEACLPCINGTYAAGGNPVCFICSPGYYSLDAAAACTKCPEGFFSDTEAASECLPCPLGHYSDSTGQDQCSECPPGYYADHEGSVTCTACPPNTNNVNPVVYDSYEVITHSTIDECFPEKGWFGPPGETPSMCPEGGSCCYCREEGEELLKLLEANPVEPCSCLGGTPIPYPQPQHSRSAYDSLVMVTCNADDICRGGGSIASDGVCAELHEGYRCGSCRDGSYMLGHQCEECTAGGAVAYLLAFILPCLIVGLIYVSTLGVRLSSMHVMTDTLQIVALMYYLPIQWDVVMDDFFLVCALANFNPQIFQTDCLFSIPYFGRSGFLLSFPLMFLGVWGLTYLFVRFITPRFRGLKSGEKVSNFQYCLWSHDVEFKNGVFIGGAVLALILMHPLLFSKSIEPFICEGEADGYYYMAAAPEYRCYEDQEWKDNLCVFLVGMVVWGLGIPVSVMVLLYRIRYRLFDYDVRVRFGLIYKGY